MRKTQWLVVLLAVLCVAGSTMATEDNWRFYVGAEAFGGGYSAPAAQVGVHPDAYDGVDSQDGAGVNYPAVIIEDAAWVVCEIPGDYTNLYLRDIKAPGIKSYTLFMAAQASAPYPTMDLFMTTLSDTYLPPASVGGVPIIYRLTMVNNQGVGPANGTTWDFEAPTVAGTEFLRIGGLPTVTFNYTADGMRMSGYQFTLEQVPVPEPSSMLALGTGLFGLAGLAIRRHRA